MVETIIRVVEIDSSASFLQLHEAIQDAVDFNNDHLFQFYLGRHPDQHAKFTSAVKNKIF